MSLASSTTLWYLSRGTGVVTLLLLTASVLLGIVTSYRWSSPAWPRFVIEFVHRNVSLLVVAFLAAHVATVIGDAYAPIGWKDALLPFLSPYRRLWLGLGTVAADILLALVITSLLRHRVGYKTWRIVHWFAYACWPLAVVHGLGTGTDAKLGVVLVIAAACVLSVVIAGALRLVAALPAHTLARRAGLTASAFAPVVLAVWLASGPLAAGWARRAGTPESVLHSASVSDTASAGTPGGGAGGNVATTGPAVPAGGIPSGGFQASTSGTFHQSAPDGNGQVVVSLVGALRGGATGSVDVELRGVPASGGGIQLERGSVTLSGATTADTYTGAVVGLDGGRLIADVANPAGSRLRVVLDFAELDPRAETMRGTVDATPIGGGNGERDGTGTDDR